MKQLILVIAILIAKITVAQNQINFKTPNGVYPEGIAYYAEEDSFLVSSITNGDIGIVDKKGNYKTFISNKNFFSTVGLKIKGDKLYVAVGDLGLAKKSNKKSPKTIARLLVFNLKTKKLLTKIDLHNLYKGNHWANDLSVADNGDVYITDSFSPVIYKVTAKGKASVFVENDKFLGKGINLNGILVHPNGYLLVAKNSDGKLFKVDLMSKEVKEVALSNPIIGIDGLLLLPDGSLLVGQNTNFEAYHKLVSNDDFSTAYIKSSDTKDLNFATTATLVNGEVYFLNSYISDLFKGKKDRTTYFIRKYAAIYPTRNIIQELNFKNIKEESFGNKISRKVIPSDEGTLAIYTLEKGAHIPKHSHPQQQTTYIRSGKVKIIINKEERILESGDVIVIPGNVSHEFFVLEKTEDIDVFSPKRESDWILGKSKFLKESK
ncbi:cupin domain-containing protein [Tenacibaculum dicentrarchi]|uniref:cupin domain-containing protein n=1 Tax=Tenacibaculum dicentrarchi TaxID=669041 RepID=UPI000C7E03C9|nr:exported hypothetical protein [Tenacibaculum dicentrarchi]